MTAKLVFDVWGCRGSRNLVPDRSRIGNRTSSYSLHDGDLLFALDAGRGLAALGAAMRREPRFRPVRTVHLLITHAHLDHWEGLKDVDWLWERENGLEVTVHGTAEALGAVRGGFEPPAYVALERLAMGTVKRLSFVERRSGDVTTAGRWEVRTFPLYHYSGGGDEKRHLSTVGYRLEASGGPTVAYLSDHEPTGQTAAAEADATAGADLLLYDAHFPDRADHAFGHGSQEHAADVARRHPDAVVLAGHLGPTLTDAAIRDAFRRHGKGLRNFQLAREGRSWVFDARTRRFEPGGR